MCNFKASGTEITHSHKISILQSSTNWTCALQINSAVSSVNNVSIMSLSDTDCDSSLELLEAAVSPKESVQALVHVCRYLFIMKFQELQALALR